MTIQEAQQQLLFRLYHIYDDREAAAITNLVMENITEWKKIDRVINKNVPLSLPKIQLLQKYTDELLQHKPVQYVLQEAWFAGMKFYVDENVLIPRPETEELVEWVIDEVRKGQETRNKAKDSKPTIHDSPFTILDVGTGSGCIPIALKKKLADAKIFSCDISETALQIARRNADENEAEMNFIHLDFLDQEKRGLLPAVDIIISNPPYVPVKDKTTMQKNVIAYEPHLALFVEDDDPLVFYEAIAGFAKEKLSPGGKVFVEIHENQALNVKKLFSFEGLHNVEIRKDLQGRERMIKATTLL